MLVNLSPDNNPTGLLGTKGMQYHRSKSNKVYFFHSFYLHYGPCGTPNLYHLYHSQQYHTRRYSPWRTATCPSLLLPVVMLTVQPFWHCPQVPPWQWAVVKFPLRIEGPPVLQVLKLVASRSCIGLELRQNILCSGWFKRKALTVLVQDQRKKVRTVPAITRKKKINENDSLTGF